MNKQNKHLITGTLRFSTHSNALIDAFLNPANNLVQITGIRVPVSTGSNKIGKLIYGTIQCVEARFLV
jgi:hypothetical protein